MTDPLIMEATAQARLVLRRCVSRLGFKASARPDGYVQVWARDSMITSLGALLLDDPVLDRAVRASIKTLQQHQTALGVIPNNVDVRSGRPNFQAYADGGLWFVVGTAAYVKTKNDDRLLRSTWPAIERALRWYAHQDGNQSGLIAIQEASDWEDLLAVRGTALTVNCLYALALRQAGDLAQRLGRAKAVRDYAARHRLVRQRINGLLWYTPGKPLADFLQFGVVNPIRQGHDRFGRKLLLPTKTVLKKSSYYLPYVTFRDFGEWFDTLGNLLAILSGVAVRPQATAILHFLAAHKLGQPYPSRALYPVIRPGDKDWRYYYRFGDLNLPHQYHNGGCWPFLGGFTVGALVAQGRLAQAKRALRSLAAMNRRGQDAPWEFTEWLHGRSGRPQGMAEQAWSAGMYVFAADAVTKGRCHFF